MLQVGSHIETRLKHEPILHGIITRHRKNGKINQWTVRLANGSIREYSTRAIKLVDSMSSEISNDVVMSSHVACLMELDNKHEQNGVMIPGNHEDFSDHYYDEDSDCCDDIRSEILESNVANTLLLGPNEFRVDDTIWCDRGPILTNPTEMYNEPARILWHHETPRQLDQRKPLDYFLRAFPQDQWQPIVVNTNRRIQLSGSVEPISIHELRRYLGIRLAIALEHNSGPVDDHWASEDESAFTRSHNYAERTGMSLTRFQIIRSSFALHNAGQVSDDPWFAVRSFIHSFGLNMRNVISPGKYLVVNDLSSLGQGKEGKYSIESRPVVGKTLVMPDNIFSEINAVADGDTGCILGFDLPNQTRTGTPVDVAPKSAVCLQLCSPWGGSSRVVIGDSAFGSVSTLKALRSRLGLFFIGCVKYDHRQFPLAILNAWFCRRVADHQPCGGWMALQSLYATDVGGVSVAHPIYAVAWHDKRCMAFVSNVGTTRLAATTSPRFRMAIDDRHGYPAELPIQFEIPRPTMVELYFRCFPIIDLSDGMRRVVSAIESSYRKESWAARVFGAVFGVAVTNAYRMYIFECKKAHHEPHDFVDFVDALAAELIDVRGVHAEKLTMARDSSLYRKTSATDRRNAPVGRPRNPHA